MARLAITNLSKGEFGPQLYGRVDVPQYSAGVKQARNFLIQRYGGMSFRPGFRFVGEVDDAEVSYRLLPFQYSIEQAYVLVLGDSQMRVVAEGGFVVEDDLKVEGVTTGATTTLHVSYHAYLVGERVYISGISGMTELNNRYATVLSIPDANHIVVDIDSTGFSAYTDSTGTVRVGAPTPPPVPDPSPPAPTTPPYTPPPTTGGGGKDLGPGPTTGGSGIWTKTPRYL